MTTDPLETTQGLDHPGRYGNPAIAFHWLSFVLVVIVGILGLLHDDWPKQTHVPDRPGNPEKPGHFPSH